MAASMKSTTYYSSRMIRIMILAILPYGKVMVTEEFVEKQQLEGRKSEQHPYHPHPKLLSGQSAEGGAHQELVSTATIEHARIDHQPSQQAPSARNEPSRQQ